MKSAIVLLISFCATSAFAHQNLSRSACKDYINSVQDHFEVIHERHTVGEVTSVDLDYARLAVLDARFDCRDISFSQYCATAPKVAKSLVIGIQEEINIGSRTTEQGIEAKRKSLLIHHQCL